MTKETLASYRTIMLSIIALHQQIEMLAHPIQSPTGKENDGAGRASAHVPSNPTERNALEIGEIEDILKDRERQLRYVVNEIESWLKEINNPEIEAIVRIHFFLGRSWTKTSREIYGSDSKESARQKFKRFMQENS